MSKMSESGSGFAGWKDEQNLKTKKRERKLMTN